MEFASPCFSAAGLTIAVAASRMALANSATHAVNEILLLGGMLRAIRLTNKKPRPPIGDLGLFGFKLSRRVGRLSTTPSVVGGG